MLKGSMVAFQPCKTGNLLPTTLDAGIAGLAIINHPPNTINGWYELHEPSKIGGLVLLYPQLIEKCGDVQLHAVL